jgi:CDP-glycerol glycerophosphotransferase
LYAPTFRDKIATRFFPFDDFNLNNLTDFLEENDTYLVLRPHHNDLRRESAFFSTLLQSPRIILGDASVLLDVSNIFPFIHGVVTDYSSIYIDLLLLDLPVIFIPYDLAEYDNDRGLAYDYSIITPGPCVLTQHEFVNAMKSALNGAPEHSNARTRVKSMFHKFSDGDACERVSQLIISKLKIYFPNF